MKAHNEILDSINQLQHLTNVKSNSNSVTIDKDALQSLLGVISNKAHSIGQIGQDWEHLCGSVNNSLTLSMDKTSTLSKRLRNVERQKNQSLTK